MKYPVYPSYVKSKAQWLDDIPEHWDSIALKWGSRRYSGGTPDKSNGAYWEEGTIPWLNSGAVNDGYITEPSAYITTEGFAGSSAKWIPKDSLVMALAGQGKTKGMVAQTGIKTTCNQSMAAIIPDHRFAPRFLYWWLASNYQNIRNMAGGEARDGLNLEMLGSIECPLLPPDEQKAIAEFLDRETGRIDALVEKKRELIARLKEKRAALISRTVTKGLPAEAAREFGIEPHTEFKPSGIDWLGDIPEGWEVKKLRFICMIETGDKDTVNADDHGEYPFFVRSQTVERIGSYTKDCEGVLTAGDGVGVGKVFHYVNGKFDFHQRVYLFSKFKGVSGKYFFLYLKELFGRVAFDGGAKSTVDSLRRPMLANFPIVVPVVDEQAIIVDYLDRETAKLDRLSEKVGEAIERLQEYRAALITAAVTGKIDVRGATGDAV